MVVTNMVAVVTMNRRLLRHFDHVVFRVFRVDGLGGSGVVVIMTVVAVFVHARARVAVARSPLMIGRVVPLHARSGVKRKRRNRDRAPGAYCLPAHSFGGTEGAPQHLIYAASLALSRPED
jgi:hypothetical protein